MRNLLLCCGLLVVAACSSDASPGATSGNPATSAASANPAKTEPKASAKPTTPATATAAASAAAPVEVKAATLPASALGVTMTIKSGAMDGSSYKAKAEVLNKGSKEMSAVSWRVCRYEADGKLTDDKTTNGENAALKPNDKTDIDVWVEPSPLVGFQVTSVKYPDGSTKEADAAAGKCPESIKP